MKLSQLLADIDYKITSKICDTEIKNIVYDSRKVTVGDAFVCIHGLEDDGAKYIPDALEKGAAAIVVEDGVNVCGQNNVVVASVNSTREALSYMFHRFCDCPSERMSMVAVTGTNGKTSTAYTLRKIFAEAGYKTGLIGTLKSMIAEDDYIPRCGGTCTDNFTTMTTPDPDFLYPLLKKMADDGVKIVFMETSSHALALAKLDPIKFKFGIFTNLSPEHLDFHKTMSTYLLAKAKLFSMCDVGIFNIDDASAEEIMGYAKCKIVTASAKIKADYTACGINNFGAHGVEYTLKSYNSIFKIESRIPGSFTVYNTLLAAACAREMKLDIVGIQNAVKSMNEICGRLQRVKLDFTRANFDVFIDYAHTPEAMKNLLSSVNDFRDKGQRIVVLFGCGGDRDKSKRAPMGKIASEYADFAIITSDNSRNENPSDIIADILKGIPENFPHTVIEKRREAIEYAIINAHENDILLLVGKGHEEYEIDKDGKHPFSEQKIVTAAVACRKRIQEGKSNESNA